jgi:hypothetical protein
VFQVVELRKKDKNDIKNQIKPWIDNLNQCKKHKILNVKNHKIFNCSKLTIVHEWLLKQRMAQKSRMSGDLAHRKRVLRKMFHSANEDFEFQDSSL